MSFLAFALAVVPVLSASPPNTPICLAPPDAQFASTDAIEASAAVAEVFTSYLSGPSVSVMPLTARLASQARLEAREAHCPYVLFVTAKRQRHKSGGVFGRIAGRAAQEAGLDARFEASTAASRLATVAATAAVRAAADMAATTRTHDEMELSYRLESGTGAVLKEAKAKRTAKSDGEDLLTPLAEHAAEEIAAMVTKDAR